MNIEYLKTLVLLDELGSFLKTSQTLKVSPSTVSKQIAQLEKETGFQLIIRDRKNVRLTPAGQIVLRHAQEALKREEQCFSELSLSQSNRRYLRIGSNQSLFLTHIGPWISAYLSENRDCTCKITTGDSQLLINDLLDSKIDICFSYRMIYENSLDCYPITEDTLVLVAGKDLEKYPGGITVEQLKKLPLIQESHLNMAAPKLYQELFNQAQNVVVNIVPGFLNRDLLVNNCGYGFALAPLIQQELRSGLLSEIELLDHPKLSIASYMIVKHTNPVITKELLDHFFSFQSNK